MGLYDFVSDENRYLLFDEIEWTLEYRNKMVSTCIDLSESAEEHPEFARKFCECSVDEVISNYSYREYAKISKLPPDEVAKEMQYIVDKCRKKVTVQD